MSDSWPDAQLQPGEQVRWLGRPDTGLLLTRYDWFMIPFSILWSTAPLSMILFSLGGPQPSFHPFLLIFVAAGPYMLIGRFLIDARLRAATRYAVTDRRALIWRGGPFDCVRSIDLAGLDSVQFRPGRGERGTLLLDPRVRWWHHDGRYWSPSLDPRPQFLAIEDAQRVLELIETVRR